MKRAPRYIKARTTECPTCLARPGVACNDIDKSVKPHAARLHAEREERVMLGYVAKMARLGFYVSSWDQGLALTRADMKAMHDIVEAAWAR